MKKSKIESEYVLRCLNCYAKIDFCDECSECFREEDTIICEEDTSWRHFHLECIEGNCKTEGVTKKKLGG